MLRVSATYTAAKKLLACGMYPGEVMGITGVYKKGLGFSISGGSKPLSHSLFASNKKRGTFPCISSYNPHRTLVSTIIGAIQSRGLKRWDEGRWVKGSLICTLLCWGLFPIPHLPSSHLLSPLRNQCGIGLLENLGYGDDLTWLCPVPGILGKLLSYRPP